MVAEDLGVLAAAPDTEVITASQYAEVDLEAVLASQDAEVDLEAVLEAGAEGELDTVVGTLGKKRDDNSFFELWHNLMFSSCLPPPLYFLIADSHPQVPLNSFLHNSHFP